MRILKLCALVVASFLCQGCVYYEVTDVSSGKEYVTNNWVMGRSGWNGATVFTDLKSGKQITLQSYELKQIPSYDAKMQIDSQKN